MAALEQRAAEFTNLTRFDDEAEAIEPDEAIVTLRTGGGTSLSARLVIGADGRQSPSREAAGIAVNHRDLDQAALTFNVGHSRPHRNISTEFHTPHGPCVFVPLPGQRCSVVWVSAPKEAERLLRDGRRRIVRGRRSAVALHSRPPPRRAGTASVSARDRNLRAVCPASHRADRRSRACAAADRRARPQHGTARRRRHRGDRRRCTGGGQRSRCAFVLERYRQARRADVASRTFVIDLANRSLLI